MIENIFILLSLRRLLICSINSIASFLNELLLKCPVKYIVICTLVLMNSTSPHWEIVLITRMSISIIWSRFLVRLFSFVLTMRRTGKIHWRIYVSFHQMVLTFYAIIRIHQITYPTVKFIIVVWYSSEMRIFRDRNMLLIRETFAFSKNFLSFWRSFEAFLKE